MDISPVDLENVMDAVETWGFEGVEAFVDILPTTFSMFPRIVDMLQKKIVETVWTLRVDLLAKSPVKSVLYDVILPCRAAGARLFTLEEGEVSWDEVEARLCPADEPLIVR
jgi:hypothetical protein